MFLFICIIYFLCSWDGFEIFQSVSLAGSFLCLSLFLLFSFLSFYFIDYIYCIFRCVVSGLSQNVSVCWKFSKVYRLLEFVNRYRLILLFFCVSIENVKKNYTFDCIFLNSF